MARQIKIPIISVYNNKRKALVEQTYNTLRKNTNYPFELFIAEDLIGDESNYIKLRNKLIKDIPYEWERMVYVDDDLFFNKGWLTKMMKAMDDNPDVWQIGAITWPSHKHFEIRQDITITDINCGGCLLIKGKVLDTNKQWVEDKTKTYAWCGGIIGAGGKIAFMNNEELVIHCGINSLLNKKGRSNKTIERLNQLANKFNAITE